MTALVGVLTHRTATGARFLARGCYRHARLLKFHVCRDAAVCTVHAGGFFSVWKGVCSRNWGRPISWPDPLAIASSAARVR
jgi:hypothetical protein